MRAAMNFFRDNPLERILEKNKDILFSIDGLTKITRFLRKKGFHFFLCNPFSYLTLIQSLSNMDKVINYNYSCFTLLKYKKVVIYIIHDIDRLWEVFQHVQQEYQRDSKIKDLIEVSKSEFQQLLDQLNPIIKYFTYLRKQRRLSLNSYDHKIFILNYSFTPDFYLYKERIELIPGKT